MSQASRVRLAVCVLLPFASGYYLSYLFRCINALIAGDLAAELGLGAADLGLLTSVYFLVFAAVQLPCGVLLDRYGPRLVDSALLLVAAAGALLFALADGVVAHLVGRALIGLGVAVGLMAGLKAIVLAPCPPRGRPTRSFRASAGAACSPGSPWPRRPWRCSSFSSCRRGSRRRLQPRHRGSASSPSTSIHASCA